MITENKIQCLIVDDEPPAIAILQKYIESVPGLMLTGACFNAVEALTVLQQKNVDLLFLDIQMPQLLGTDFIRTLKNPPKVIFTTAYRKYAVEGFELDAVDYLLKPVSFERFIKAVNKVMQTQVQPAGEPVEISDGSKDGAFIYFRADRKMVKVFLKDILYVESLKDYIKVITSFRQIITKQSISSLEAMLPANQFVRIHRSYLVAISKIDSFTADDIEIQKRKFLLAVCTSMKLIEC